MGPLSREWQACACLLGYGRGNRQEVKRGVARQHATRRCALQSYTSLSYADLLPRYRRLPPSKPCSPRPPAPRRSPAGCSHFSAYYDFGRSQLTNAAQNPNYNPANHANDFLDAQQLIYLAAPDHHFISCDQQFRRYTAASEQAERIHTAAPADLTTFDNAVAFIAAAIT